jgi:hypothetical protein
MPSIMPFGNGSGDKVSPLNVNAGTHKKVFYRIVSGVSDEILVPDEYIARILQEIANLVLECNGRVYGATPMSEFKVLISFEVPRQYLLEFLEGEKKIK